MSKIVLFALVFVLSMVNTGVCAVADPSEGLGEVQVGYNYYDLKKTSGGNNDGKAGVSEVYGTAGIGFGYAAFVSYAHGAELTYTDYGLKSTMLIPNISLMVGQRRMKENDNTVEDKNLFYGVSAKQDLGSLTLYGTYQKGSNFKDEVAAVSYAIDNQMYLDISWKKYDTNEKDTYKGYGCGVIYKF